MCDGTEIIYVYLFHLISRPHHGPGSDSASNVNEYHKSYQEVKAAGAIKCQFSTIYGTLNLLELYGPVHTCNGVALPS